MKVIRRAVPDLPTSERYVDFRKDDGRFLCSCHKNLSGKWCVYAFEGQFIGVFLTNYYTYNKLKEIRDAMFAELL